MYRRASCINIENICIVFRLPWGRGGGGTVSECRVEPRYLEKWGDCRLHMESFLNLWKLMFQFMGTVICIMNATGKGTSKSKNEQQTY